MNKRLFVGGIPFSISKDELVALFTQAGTVVSANIISDKFTGQSKGFGFIEMETEEQAQAAITQFNGYELAGRKLGVAAANPIEPRKFEKRSFGGGEKGSFNSRREGGRGNFGRDSRGGRDRHGSGGRRGGFGGRGGGR